MDAINRRTWGPTPNYPSVLAYRPPTSPLAHEMTVIAGPCSVECEEQIYNVASCLASWNVDFLRGGVYRAGTYPGPTFGYQMNLAKLMKHAAKEYALKTIMEVLDVRLIDKMEPFADAFQVGARHMQDYALLKELSTIPKVVTLKRHPGSTLDEFLGAAEYLARGRCKPILIERGGSTHMNHVRWDLSISLIAAVKTMTRMPILVDASHGTGRRDLVGPMTLAGIAAGADGFLVEVHPEPEKSLSDADQAYPLHKFGDLRTAAKVIFDTVRES